jgi:medium-chain acyl-[acyl-carrier-protein] hydrolase
MHRMTSKWFWRPNPKPHPRVRLFCLPYAGGDGITLFRGWPGFVPAEIEVVCLLLPGRGSRILEPMITKMSDLVAEICGEMLPLLDRPFSIFGYSMGASISFEIAVALRQRYRCNAAHLFLAAREGPEQRTERVTYNLPREALIADLQRQTGIPPAALHNQQLMDLIMPTLRADLELCQTSVHTSRPVDSPITVFGGNSDEITRDSLLSWQRLTTRRFTLYMLEGNHFFIRTAEKEMLGIMTKELMG